MDRWSDIRTDREEKAIRSFLRSHFPAEFVEGQLTLSEYEEGNNTISYKESKQITALINEAGEQFESSKGTLGLAIDFVVLTEKLAQNDESFRGFTPDAGVEDVLDRYKNKAKSTLTLQRGEFSEGIRSYHNDLIDLFREDLNRTNFPSSPGHHTGEWERYDNMLELALSLSNEGRYVAAQRLFDLGLNRLESKEFEHRVPPFTKPFLRVLKGYERRGPDEQGGSAYQALCYGYVKSEWPHLSLRASKVRTGSARQQRHGDIDGYHGPDLMISVEVKDRDIDSSNVKSELGTMLKVAEDTTAIAIAICKNIDDDARQTLEDGGVRVLDDGDLARQLQFWDFHKQNRALHGMLHFLANIEENSVAVQRLLRFISENDPDNRVLDHLADTNVKFN